MTRHLRDDKVRSLGGISSSHRNHGKVINVNIVFLNRRSWRIHRSPTAEQEKEEQENVLGCRRKGESSTLRNV